MVNKNLIFEDAHIIFRNFSGKKTKYNEEGKRSFCLVIDDDERAAELIEDGWNIHRFSFNNEDDESNAYLNIAVKFNGNHPKVFVVANGEKTQLFEETIGTLDTADICSVDVAITPYSWRIGGKVGIKAYLKTLYVLLNEEDEFADKYSQDGERKENQNDN